MIMTVSWILISLWWTFDSSAG